MADLPPRQNEILLAPAGGHEIGIARRKTADDPDDALELPGHSLRHLRSGGLAGNDQKPSRRKLIDQIQRPVYVVVVVIERIGGDAVDVERLGAAILSSIEAPE